MKRFLRTVFFLLLAFSLLTVSAFADMGPKPQLVVRVENPPEELYYLDLLAEGAPDACKTLSEYDFKKRMEDLGIADPDHYYAFISAVPQGWHGCLSQPMSGAPIFGQLTGVSQDGAMLHQFGYYGVPDTYRILMVSRSGEVFLSDPYTREVLQSSATLDWAAKTVTIPPTSTAYAVQFLATFLPTLVLEGLLLALFGLGRKLRNWGVFLLTNLVTQGALSLFFGMMAVRGGVGLGYPFLLVIAEAGVLLVEWLLYRRFLTGPTQERITAYAVTANTCTAILGFMTAEPIWRFVLTFL